MKWDSEFIKPEIRNGFEVDEKRKKIWAVELDLLDRFDAFCKEFGLSYSVEYGTLLGAVRHGGFVPWDDDIDVMMMRPDYNRLLELAPEYFSHPYYFQHFYKDPGMPVWGLAKLMNEETACIEDRTVPEGYHSGIFLDIFAFDDVLGSEGQNPVHTKMISETWMTIHDPDKLDSMIAAGYESALPPDMLGQLRIMGQTEQLRILDGLLASSFGSGAYVNTAAKAMKRNVRSNRKREWHEKLEYLPFEGRQVPVPAQYKEVLTAIYGEDFMTPKQRPNAHGSAIIDPDKSYLEY